MLRDSVASVTAFLARADRTAVARDFTTTAVRRFPPVTYDSGSGGEEEVTMASAPVAAWSELFGEGRVAGESASAAVAAEELSRPIRLEVGAGTGDWVVGRAEAERDRCHWAAIELRCVQSPCTHATLPGTAGLSTALPTPSHRLPSHIHSRQVRPCVPDPCEGGDARPRPFGPRRPRG